MTTSMVYLVATYCTSMALSYKHIAGWYHVVASHVRVFDATVLRRLSHLRNLLAADILQTRRANQPRYLLPVLVLLYSCRLSCSIILRGGRRWATRRHRAVDWSRALYRSRTSRRCWTLPTSRRSSLRRTSHRRRRQCIVPRSSRFSCSFQFCTLLFSLLEVVIHRTGMVGSGLLFSLR